MRWRLRGLSGDQGSAPSARQHRVVTSRRGPRTDPPCACHICKFSSQVVPEYNSWVIFFLEAEKWSLSHDDSCPRAGHPGSFSLYPEWELAAQCPRGRMEKAWTSQVALPLCSSPTCVGRKVRARGMSRWLGRLTRSLLSVCSPDGDENSEEGSVKGWVVSDGQSWSVRTGQGSAIGEIKGEPTLVPERVMCWDWLCTVFSRNTWFL